MHHKVILCFRAGQKSYEKVWADDFAKFACLNQGKLFLGNKKEACCYHQLSG